MQKSLLPTMIRDIYAVTKPLSATEVKATLSSLNEVIRVRLRLWEIVPLEWSGYTIGETFSIHYQFDRNLINASHQTMAASISPARISLRLLSV